MWTQGGPGEWTMGEAGAVPRNRLSSVSDGGRQLVADAGERSPGIRSGKVAGAGDVPWPGAGRSRGRHSQVGETSLRGNDCPLSNVGPLSGP